MSFSKAIDPDHDIVITIIMITTQSTPTTAPIIAPLQLLSQLQVSIQYIYRHMQESKST